MSVSTTDSSGFTGERVLGRVKWFNNRAGFGFISVLEGEKSGEDLFTHHSGISVDTEQYKYLVQGFYVEFELQQVITKNILIKQGVLGVLKAVC